jgi:L-fuconolactonase
LEAAEGNGSRSEPLRLIDAHVHLWELSAHQWYPAMQDPEIAKTWASLGDISRMARDFLFADYRAETAGYDVVGLVHVSATTAPRAYLDESAWLERILDDTELPAATIGTVEPTLAGAELVAELEAQAASHRFRGVRVLSGLDPGSTTAEELCSWLEDRELVFDLVAHPSQAVGFARLLARHPRLDVVLEHAGWPDGTGGEEYAAWRAAISELAANERVSCKISGLAMVTHTLDAQALRPWIDACLEVFGVGRCMFGGNFPVDAMYGTFPELMTSVLAATESLTPAERDVLFVDNARRVYGL